MTPHGAVAVSLVLLAAAPAPAAAQPGEPSAVDRYRLPFDPLLEAPLAPRADGLSFRIREIVEPDGSRKMGRGLIAGVEVAPDAIIGLGLFESLPKRVDSAEESPLDQPKRSRKAAVGLTLKF